MQKSQPAKTLLQKLWKWSSSWMSLRLKPAADLNANAQISPAKLFNNHTLGTNRHCASSVASLSVSQPMIKIKTKFGKRWSGWPLDDPDEAQQQVRDSGQQIRQRQVVGDAGMNVLQLIVAVEEVGVLQEALHTHTHTHKHKHTDTETDAHRHTHTDTHTDTHTHTHTDTHTQTHTHTDTHRVIHWLEPQLYRVMWTDAAHCSR